MSYNSYDYIPQGIFQIIDFLYKIMHIDSDYQHLVSGFTAGSKAKIKLVVLTHLNGIKDR